MVVQTRAVSAALMLAISLATITGCKRSAGQAQPLLQPGGQPDYREAPDPPAAPGAVLNRPLASAPVPLFPVPVEHRISQESAPDEAERRAIEVLLKQLVVKPGDPWVSADKAQLALGRDLRSGSSFAPDRLVSELALDAAAKSALLQVAKAQRYNRPRVEGDERASLRQEALQALTTARTHLSDQLLLDATVGLLMAPADGSPLPDLAFAHIKQQLAAQAARARLSPGQQAQTLVGYRDLIVRLSDRHESDERAHRTFYRYPLDAKGQPVSDDALGVFLRRLPRQVTDPDLIPPQEAGKEGQSTVPGQVASDPPAEYERALALLGKLAHWVVSDLQLVDKQNMLKGTLRNAHVNLAMPIRISVAPQLAAATIADFDGRPVSAEFERSGRNTLVIAKLHLHGARLSSTYPLRWDTNLSIGQDDQLVPTEFKPGSADAARALRSGRSEAKSAEWVAWLGQVTAQWASTVRAETAEIEQACAGRSYKSPPKFHLLDPRSYTGTPVLLKDRQYSWLFRSLDDNTAFASDSHVRTFTGHCYRSGIVKHHSSQSRDPYYRVFVPAR